MKKIKTTVSFEKTFFNSENRECILAIICFLLPLLVYIVKLIFSWFIYQKWLNYEFLIKVNNVLYYILLVLMLFQSIIVLANLFNSKMSDINKAPKSELKENLENGINVLAIFQLKRQDRFICIFVPIIFIVAFIEISNSIIKSIDAFTQLNALFTTFVSYYLNGAAKLRLKKLNEKSKSKKK